MQGLLAEPHNGRMLLASAMVRSPNSPSILADARALLADWDARNLDFLF